MPQKRKRTWSIKEPSSKAGSFKDRQEAREHREEYKRARVQQLMGEGVTKDGFACMQEHPGKYCSDCNPRIQEASDDEQLKDMKKTKDLDDEEDDASLNDEQHGEGSSHTESDEDTKFEEADLSEPWSDGSSSSEGGRSPTYSEIFTEEAEEVKLLERWQYSIERVDNVANRLAAMDIQTLSEAPIGGLRGEWDLYSPEVRPTSLDDASFYCRLFITEDAAEGRLPSRERMVNSPFDQFIEWTIKDQQGDVAPFQLPSHPSPEAIPITLMVGPRPDLPAEIMFLGSNCLRFRVPRLALFPNESVPTGGFKSMIEFAGLRQRKWISQDRERI